MLRLGNTAFPGFSGFLGRDQILGVKFEIFIRGNWLMQMLQLGPKYPVYIVFNLTESWGPS